MGSLQKSKEISAFKTSFNCGDIRGPETVPLSLPFLELAELSEPGWFFLDTFIPYWQSPIPDGMRPPCTWGGTRDIHNFIKFNGQILADLKNKPTEYPKQPETKTVTKHAMSEVCLLPSPSYSRGRACKAQSKHKHFMKKRFSKSVCSTVAAEGPIFPKLVRTVFPKELLSASLFISFT